MTLRVCPQCGRTLEDTEFRQYTYQSSRATAPRRNTICRDCENFNQSTDRAYRADPRTRHQQAIVDEATEIYRQLIERGLEPRGRLASTLTGRKPKHCSSASKYVANVLTDKKVSDAVIVRKESNNESM